MLQPIYYATGAALIGLSLVALLLPPDWPLFVTGSGAAIILWTTILCLLRRVAPRLAGEPGQASPA